MSASEESFTSEAAAKEVGMVAKTLLDVFWGFRAGRDLMQQSSVTQGFGLGVELIMVLLSESEDSVSACSKKYILYGQNQSKTEGYHLFQVDTGELKRQYGARRVQSLCYRPFHCAVLT